MLDSELNSHDTENNPGGFEQQETTAGVSQQETPAGDSRPQAQGKESAPSVPAALFHAPQVLFQPPAQVAAPPAGRDTPVREAGDGSDESGTDSAPSRAARRTTRGGRGSRGGRGTRGGDAVSGSDDDLFSAGSTAGADGGETDAQETGTAATGDQGEDGPAGRRRRRRTSRGRGRSEAGEGAEADGHADESAAAADADSAAEGDRELEADTDADAESGEGTAAGRRRRRKRRRGSADADVTSPDDPPDTVVHVREANRPADDVRAIKGSTRLEAKKQRRREGRESGRRRPPVITESEFLARRESVERTMVVRQRGDRTQIAVLEDGVLVEHYVNRTTHQSYVGNVYLGKVQNVLPSMEAAFVDIGKGRNAVLYAGEVNFDASGLEGQPKRIESALKAGQSVIVQVTKDPVGHKGARLTSQVSLPGRYLVYVPGASMTGISRKLPDTERNRLKHILKKVTPENAGVIVRTAAEGAAEAELDRDVSRLAAQWENIEKKAKTANAPALLYGEPDLTIRVVRDVFNEDFTKLIVSGEEGWDTIDEYVRYVAPHLADRLTRWDDADDRDDDVFAAYRIDEQLAKALERKVWLPSGGSLVIDRTEAMTVIDVNTGKFTGQGGNLEETVTRNNLEAAEEIVRQLRLRDVGGIVVIDFIDMVLESNRELVLRRLLECLARDRTKHQVAEVTSLGLVQMTRKRVGAGLLEAFSQPCECCNGRGVIITLDQPEPAHRSSAGHPRRPGSGNGHGNGNSAGNGRSGRPAQDAPDTQDAKDDPPQRGRRNRRDGRDGRTNGGTASASLVTVADAAPAATPITVANDVPPVMPPVDTTPADATPVGTTPVGTTPVGTTPVGTTPVGTTPADTPPADPAAPVRRTRAGSAMARLSVTTDQPAPVVTVTVPADPEPPVTDAASVTAAPPVTDAPPVADTAPATDVPPVADTAPATEAPEPTDAVPAPETAPVPEPVPPMEAVPLAEALDAMDASAVVEATPAWDQAAGLEAPAEAEIVGGEPQVQEEVPAEAAPTPDVSRPGEQDEAPEATQPPTEGAERD
jgi:ribonuclease E